MIKGIFFLLSAMLCLNLYSFDHISVKGGLNSSNVYGTDVPNDFKSVNKINIGLAVSKNIYKGNDFQMELNYTQKGSRVMYFNQKYNVDVKTQETYSYIEVPLLFKSTFGKENASFSIFGGPSFAYLVSAKNVTTVSNQSICGDVSGTMNNIDLSMILGADFKLSQNLYADCRYNYSMSKTYNMDLNVKNRVLSLSLGYLLK